MRRLAVYPRRQSFSGFSLIELVIILVMMGIIFLIFSPKVFNSGSVTMGIQAKTFAADIRRAQLLATTRGINLAVCTSNLGYSIQLGTGCGSSPILDPAGGSFLVTFKNGVTLGGSSLGSAWYFDSAGVPSSGAVYEVIPTSGTAITISVAPITGHVTLN